MPAAAAAAAAIHAAGVVPPVAVPAAATAVAPVLRLGLPLLPIETQGKEAAEGPPQHRLGRRAAVGVRMHSVGMWMKTRHRDV